MTTIQYFRWLYHWNRALYSPVKALLMAIKDAFRSSPSRNKL